MLGLTYEELMVEFLGRRKISFIDSTPEELALEAKQEAHWLDEFTLGELQGFRIRKGLLKQNIRAGAGICFEVDRSLSRLTQMFFA